MMRFHFYVLLCFLAILSSCGNKTLVSTTPSAEVKEGVSGSLSIMAQLDALEGVSVKEIANDFEGSHIAKTYELQFKQPVDHSDPSKGYFNQKVYLSHAATDAPMVMYLNGYIAGNNRYLTEPAQMLRANQIHVEHRYFSGSVPSKGIDWSTLNIEQSAADHHQIVELLKRLYTGPWLNTGISKGGQTTMYHRKFYPNDVAASLVYVAPLNLALEDERIYQFLDTVGGAECQKSLRAYQLEMLLNYDIALGHFDRMGKERGYEYKKDVASVFELSILEYGFAFFQWSGDCTLIPDKSKSLEEKVAHLFEIDAPGFFTASGIESLYPFFHQSYTEMGMYGYRVDSLAGLTRQYKENFSNYRTFIDESIDLVYDGSTHQEVKSWLDANGNNMIYLVGEIDPWSATSYIPTENTNAKKYTVKNGNHGSRLRDLSIQEQDEVKGLLMKWMGL